MSDLVGIILIIVLSAVAILFAVIISGINKGDKQIIENQNKIIKELEDKLNQKGESK